MKTKTLDYTIRSPKLVIIIIQSIKRLTEYTRLISISPIRLHPSKGLTSHTQRLEGGLADRYIRYVH